MKNNRSTFSIILKVCFLTLSLWVIPACSPGGVFSLQPTITPTPTNTATSVPTSTSTPVPTNTSVPTRTPTPTPAPVGSAVRFGSVEITVVDVVNRESVHFGDVSSGWETFYKPNPGYFLIDVGVLIHNLKPGNATTVKWGDIYVIEENGDFQLPIWGNTKTVSAGETVDPFGIGLSSTDLDRDADVEFDNDTYLRMIFGIKDNPRQTILFGIQDSPMISFTVE